MKQHSTGTYLLNDAENRDQTPTRRRVQGTRTALASKHRVIQPFVVLGTRTALAPIRRILDALASSARALSGKL